MLVSVYIVGCILLIAVNFMHAHNMQEFHVSKQRESVNHSKTGTTNKTPLSYSAVSVYDCVPLCVRVCMCAKGMCACASLAYVYTSDYH